MSSQSGNDGSYTLTVTFDVRHGPEHGAGHGAEPRDAGDALVAHPGPEPRDPDPQADARHPLDHQPLQSGPPLRRPVSEQLRRDPLPGRGAARGRRVGRLYVRRARLQHSRLARSAKDGRLGHQCRRRGGRHPAARTSTCPPGNSARRLRPPASPGKFPSTPWAASASRSNSATSSSRSVQSSSVPMSTVAAGPVADMLGRRGRPGYC